MHLYFYVYIPDVLSSYSNPMRQLCPVLFYHLISASIIFYILFTLEIAFHSFIHQVVLYPTSFDHSFNLFGCPSFICFLSAHQQILKGVLLHCQNFQLRPVIYHASIGHSRSYGRYSAEKSFQKLQKRVKTTNRTFFVSLPGNNDTYICFTGRIGSP